MDGTIASVTGGDSNLAVHAAYPTAGPSAGPYPIVVVGHGFILPATQYIGYLQRLASFGYVALSVNFPGNDNAKGPKDLLAGIDWATSQTAFSADGSNVGMSGHSLGGKLALIAATMDPRVKAAFLLDPVDGGGPTGCNPPSCVDASALMPSLHIPTGFIGELTDMSGGFQPCAPAANNFTTFYAGTNAPSVEITALGANHMSFVDDMVGCGILCSLCNPATAANADVNSMARAFMVAFYQRHLNGMTGYDTWLTGAQAQATFVTPGLATITSR